MAEFQPFVMERMMSKWENVVDFNLSESGVHPLTLSELLAMAGQSPADLGDVLINYPQANGTVELRQTVANYYPGATADNVLITTGAAEANYLTIHTLLAPGDEAVILMPNYMQVWGIAKNLGVAVKTAHLVEERGWAPDLDELKAKVSSKTKLIAVCNPNNPTGRIMTEAEMSAIVAIAAKVGAWILADEVYAGAERETDTVTPSFYGRYDRVVAMGSMSKAYGLPGLRTGWAVGPANTLDEMWARHEYTTITTTMLSDKLTALAMSPQVRPKLLARTRKFIRDGYPILTAWAAARGNMFRVFPPQAAAIAFIRYNADINSTALMEKLRQQQSVLIVPGDHFGLDRYLRISFGLPKDYLTKGLARIDAVLATLPGH
ncbi:MAG: aminotransferase class I/II-fold pyridoxal phosphate-dependent enzyme [Alphaproteobacteria bacterium]|nr:aminotransferase class I/II-fold pyridoxal phosphate-dependent enzyme [Alphaproteobacteria bacterium]